MWFNCRNFTISKWKSTERMLNEQLLYYSSNAQESIYLDFQKMYTLPDVKLFDYQSNE